METTRLSCCFLLFLYACTICSSFSHCDARKLSTRYSFITGRRSGVKRLGLDSTNTDPYYPTFSSPFSLPPFDSLAPIPLPETNPPFCLYPPFTPSPPTTAVPSPFGGGSGGSGGGIGGMYTPSPPPPLTYSPTPIFNPPVSYTPFPSPPALIYPSPPPGSSIPLSPPPYSTPSTPSGPILSPPYYYEPSPPSYAFPNPPTGFVPNPPPVFEPPIVYPPPTGPPPPFRGPSTALWCVAKPSVPDPIIQEAMNYACGSGADCDSLQPSGACFQPNTLLAHASYAFNSYWQRTKVAGGTCEFGGSAMLVTVDPSYDGCHFIYF